MRSLRHCFLIIGMFLLCALLYAGLEASPAFAANLATDVHSVPSQYFEHHDQPKQNYSKGHTDGYNDCANGLRAADIWFRSQSYQNGYNSGYQACQDQRQQGSKQGYNEGRSAGDQTCQQQYQQQNNIAMNKGVASNLPPGDQSYQSSYDQGWQDGYHQCRVDHGDQ